VEALAAGGTGRAVAWFPKACYLEGPGGLIAAVSPGVHDGPLYLVLDRALTETEPGTAAAFSPDGVTSAEWTIDAGRAELWAGALPEPAAVRAAAAPIAEVAGEAAAASLLPRAGLDARPLVERDDLEAAAALLAGLGPGLTPSGDDVLGGTLFARRALAGTAEEPRLAAIAESVRTNAVARAFLRWAARGQALSPVHDLVGAAARGDLDRARAAAGALVAVGESSGADFALGLRWGIVRA
jgi:hypothetical protein